MKKLMLAAAFLAASVCLSAQQKGDFAVGGLIGVEGGSSHYVSKTTVSGNTETVKDDSPSPTNLSFSPQFSYFVIDNLELSAGLYYGMSKSYSSETASGKKLYSFRHTALGVIGAHYYIPLVSGKLFYTPGIQLGFGGGSSVRQTGDSQSTTTKNPFTFSIDFNFGKIEFKPVDYIGVFANLLDFSIVTATKTTDLGNNISTKTSSTSLSSGLNYGLSLGAKFYF